MTMLTTRRGTFGFLLFLLALSIAVRVPAASSEKTTGVTAGAALAALKDGNARFAAGKAQNPDSTIARAEETARNGQYPIVTILSCSDSRVPVERIFDQGIGNMFVVRVAGNVAATDEIGSIEYGTAHLGTPLLVVLGHTACGAVMAVATGAQVEPSLQALLDNIKPAVEKARREHPDLSGKDIVPAAITDNIWLGIENTLTRSEVVKGLVRDGKLEVVGALYDISTGKVEWLGRHPDQDRLIGIEKEAPAPAAAR